MKTNSKLPFIHGIKRTVSVLLSILIVAGIFTALPFTVGAAETSSNKTQSIEGQCGDNVVYQYDNGVLTISGTGKMYNYSLYSFWGALVPWDSYKDSITTVIIENGVTSIGNYAFHDCTELACITIGNNITSIGAYAFNNCENLNKIYINDLSAWCNIENKNNLEYSYDLYLNNELITNLVIPNTITTIKQYGFSYCSSITNVTIPNTVTSIDDYAFNNCVGIKKRPTIPDGCNVSTYAFYGCGYSEGTCGNNLEWILEDGILTISGTGEMNDYSPSRPYNNYPSSLPWISLRSSITSVVIESGVTSIGGYAFWDCSNLTNVSISNSVTSIGGYAFYQCSAITSITIPNSVTSISGAAFRDCTGLKNITIPDSVTSIEGFAFTGCSSLESIVIPNSITKINNSMFKDSGLINVTLPNSITYINESAFENCENLKTVNLSSKLTIIERYVFKRCSNLETITIPDSVTTIYQEAFAFCDKLTNITFPNSIALIGNSAFQGCTGLKSITIPSGVTTIGNRAFSDCTGLTNITVDSNNSAYDSRNNCNAIIESSINTLVAGCKNTVIPNTVTSIGNSVFSNCTELTSVTIPNSVTSIGNSAFSGCTGLTSIDIPNSVTSIGIGAFENCINVSTLTFGNCLEQIGSGAFQNCKAITTIAFPDSLSYIGDTAFCGCENLVSITHRPDNCTVEWEAFEGCQCAFGSLNNNIQWTLDNHTMNVTGTGSMPIYISGRYQFDWYYMKNNIRSVIIDDGVENITRWAFWDYKNISSVIVGNDVTSIGDSAFKGCENANIVVPDSVKSIGNYAFYNCNMVICPLDSYTYDLLTGDNFTQYRTSNTMVVGIVTAKSQLNYILRKKSSKSTSSKNNIKSKIITGAAAKYSTGEEEVEEEVLTPEQIAENLSHVQCYVVEDLDVDETLTFDSDLDVTLHLNNFETDSKGNVKVDNNGKIVDGEPHTLTASTRDAMIEVPGNGKLTIEATSESNGGLINTKGAVFDVKDGGSLTIKNGTYSEDVSKYTPDNKVMGKTNGLYTVLNPKTEDMTLDNDGRQVIMPNNQDTFARNDLVGVQMRAAEEREYINEGDGQIHTVNVGEGMRFVSVVRSDILRGAKDYGYVIVKATNKDFIDNNKDKLVANGSGCKTVSLKGTNNTLAKSEYSSANLNEGKYKYLTTAVTGIKNDNDAVGVRFYIKRADGTYVYADYTCCATMGMIKAA